LGVQSVYFQFLLGIENEKIEGLVWNIINNIILTDDSIQWWNRNHGILNLFQTLLCLISESHEKFRSKTYLNKSPKDSK